MQRNLLETELHGNNTHLFLGDSLWQNAVHSWLSSVPRKYHKVNILHIIYNPKIGFKHWSPVIVFSCYLNWLQLKLNCTGSLPTYPQTGHLMPQAFIWYLLLEPFSVKLIC